jgi:acyl carrier protein
MYTAEQLQHLLADVLQVETSEFDHDTELLGTIAEFDSMAVVSLITALEQQLNISIADDELETEAFVSFGSLLALIHTLSA